MFIHGDPELATKLSARPNVEVFYFNGEGRSNPLMVDGLGAVYEAGWYWWPRYEGEDPYSDPEGPFETEQEAIEDAQSGDWWY